jgi:hypothetical protein
VLAMTWWVPAGSCAEGVHVDAETRLGVDYLCGTCDPHRFRPTLQIFVDGLVPIVPMGRGALEIGPYVKGALLDGVRVPQIAGGAALGYRIARYEILVNFGLAYATENIGQGDGMDSHQTKGTYDLGLALRYDVGRYYVSLGYKHNSNGEDLGMNMFGQNEHNPGIDGVFVGVGLRLVGH